MAGHETASIAVTWTLYALSQMPDVQRKLREELRAASSNPDMDELNTLPYLDKVLREVLRLYSPAVYTVRAASKDTVVPVSKPYVDRYGKTRNEIWCVSVASSCGFSLDDEEILKKSIQRRLDLSSNFAST
jgi:hypothetical protein